MQLVQIGRFAGELASFRGGLSGQNAKPEGQGIWIMENPKGHVGQIVNGVLIYPSIEVAAFE
ncbi:hypothetical protein [Siccirubricoccus phaeus]|uniref:hypothetical protein n=1 Tax=Siccirubricoccus phaeus TaxID=2595053 RepID=UPI0011F1984C|nr:hypothetical protein [Siccirubricoccus phaeus]